MNTLVAGGRGLEVRGDGAGQAVPVDLHCCLHPRNSTHHPSGTFFIWQYKTHRHPVLQDSKEKNEDDDDGTRRGLNYIKISVKFTISRQVSEICVIIICNKKFLENSCKYMRIHDHQKLDYVNIFTITVTK